MAYRYEFGQAAAKDLFKLTRHNAKLINEIATRHIPEILRDPYDAGEQKRGELKGVWGYNIQLGGTAYRMLYTIAGDVVTFVAIGPHDEAYARGTRRS